MKILFLCVANSARSQLAEAEARRLFKNKAEVASAGSQPSGSVNRFAKEVLEEKGFSIASHTSKHWTDLPKDFMNSLDFVITLCAEELCPVVPSKAQRLHWPLPDPASAGNTDSERKRAFENTLSEISRRLTQFGKEKGLL